MVSADDEYLDIRLVKSPELIGEKARRFHRSLFAVVEVAAEHQRLDFLFETKVYDSHEHLTAGVAN